MSSCRRTRMSPRQMVTAGDSALIQAIDNSDANAVESLLRGGADANQVFRTEGSQCHITPLLAAVRHRQVEIIQLLVSHKADMNALTQGHRPLISAARNNDFHIVTQLLELGADPDVQDLGQNTALLWAVRHGQLEAVKTLIEGYGANVNLAGLRTSVLHEALSEIPHDIAKYLLCQGANPNTTDEFGETPMFRAIRMDKTDIVQSLLDAGGDANVINTDSKTPLHISAGSVHSNVALTKMLLGKGARLDAMDRFDNSPLSLCLTNYSLRPNYPVARCLMQHGSDLHEANCAESVEWTTDHRLGQYQVDLNFKMTKFAIKAGFRLNGRQWVKDLLKTGITLLSADLYPEDREYLEARNDFILFLRSHTTNAQPLTILCRTAIRELLIRSGTSVSIFPTIGNLPLPGNVKTFLKMEDED